MNVLAVIQARMGSSRFPGKVLADLCGHPVLWHVVTRTREAVANTVVACPAGDQAIVDYCRTQGFPVFAWDGPEEDCLGRYAACVQSESLCAPVDLVVRITADCPLIDPLEIKGVLMSAETPHTYLRNSSRVPHGQDVEIWDAAFLRWSAANVDDPWCREHVKPYRMPEPVRPPGEPTEVNTPEDLHRLRAMLGA